MNEIKKNLKIFVDAVKSSDVYLNYYKQKEILSANPLLLSQVNDFRAQNFALQTTKNADNLYDEIDCFEMQYAEFRRNPEVNAFLEAELAYCRLMQDIDDALAVELAADFE